MICVSNEYIYLQMIDKAKVTFLTYISNDLKYSKGIRYSYRLSALDVYLRTCSDPRLIVATLSPALARHCNYGAVYSDALSQSFSRKLLARKEPLSVGCTRFLP